MQIRKEIEKRINQYFTDETGIPTFSEILYKPELAKIAGESVGIINFYVRIKDFKYPIYHIFIDDLFKEKLTNQLLTVIYESLKAHDANGEEVVHEAYKHMLNKLMTDDRILKKAYEAYYTRAPKEAPRVEFDEDMYEIGRRPSKHTLTPEEKFKEQLRRSARRSGLIQSAGDFEDDDLSYRIEENPKVICAWCKKTIGERNDISADSHGICKECAKKVRETEMLRRRK